jgi:hypothetical protein
MYVVIPLVLVCVLLVVIAYFVTRSQHRVTGPAMRVAASRLGGHFEPGRWFGANRVSASIQGFGVTVQSYVVGRHTEATVIVVLVKGAYPIDMVIHRAAGHRVSRAERDIPDLWTGDRAIDAAWTVRGHSEAARAIARGLAPHLRAIDEDSREVSLRRSTLQVQQKFAQYPSARAIAEVAQAAVALAQHLVPDAPGARDAAYR